MRTAVSWIRIGLLTGLIGAALLLVGGPQPARAVSPFYVRTDGDDGLCNGTADAPAAVAPACAKMTIGAAVSKVDPGSMVIIGPGTFNETVSVGIDLTIEGAGRASTIVDGGGSATVFRITGNQVSISRLTIQDGTAAGGGGGIYNAHHLTLTDVRVTGNNAVFSGGGIYHASTTEKLLITDSILDFNDASNSTASGGPSYLTASYPW